MPFYACTPLDWTFCAMLQLSQTSRRRSRVAVVQTGKLGQPAGADDAVDVAAEASQFPLLAIAYRRKRMMDVLGSPDQTERNSFFKSVEKNFERSMLARREDHLEQLYKSDEKPSAVSTSSADCAIRQPRRLSRFALPWLTSVHSWLRAEAIHAREEARHTLRQQGAARAGGTFEGEREPWFEGAGEVWSAPHSLRIH